MHVETKFSAEISVVNTSQTIGANLPFFNNLAPYIHILKVSYTQNIKTIL